MLIQTAGRAWVSNWFRSDTQRVGEENVSLGDKHAAERWELASHLMQHLLEKVFLLAALNLFLARQHTK